MKKKIFKFALKIKKLVKKRKNPIFYKFCIFFRLSKKLIFEVFYKNFFIAHSKLFLVSLFAKISKKSKISGIDIYFLFELLVLKP